MSSNNPPRSARTTRTTRASGRSTPRQLLVSVCFVLCAFFVSAGLPYVVQHAHTVHQLVQPASAELVHFDTEKGHGSPTPISPDRRPSTPGYAALALALALGS